MDDPNSLPKLQVVRTGILFRSVDPRQRGHRALFHRHSRPFSRFATCRCAGRNRIIFDSALLGEGRKNRILVKITLSLFEEATLGVAPLPDGHSGISKVPISSFDIATVGTANEDPRKIPRIIFYAHLAAPAEISSKDIRPVSDLFEMDAVLQEPASCFGQETRPEGHAIRRQIKTQSALQLLPDGQRRTQQRRMDASLVDSGDFHGEPTLEFTQRKNRAFFGRVAVDFGFKVGLETCLEDSPVSIGTGSWPQSQLKPEIRASSEDGLSFKDRLPPLDIFVGDLLLSRPDRFHGELVEHGEDFCCYAVRRPSQRS